MPRKWHRRVSYTHMAKRNRNPNTYYAVDRRRNLLFKFRYREHRQQMVRDNPALADIDSATFRELSRKHTFTVQDFTGITPPTPPQAVSNIETIAKAVADALKPYVRKPAMAIAGEQPVAARTVTDH